MLSYQTIKMSGKVDSDRKADASFPEPYFAGGSAVQRTLPGDSPWKGKIIHKRNSPGIYNHFLYLAITPFLMKRLF